MHVLYSYIVRQNCIAMIKCLITELDRTTCNALIQEFDSTTQYYKTDIIGQDKT